MLREQLKRVPGLRPAFRRIRSARLPILARSSQAVGPDGLPVPPPQLLELVAGRTDVDHFFTLGRLGNESLREILNANNVELDHRSAVLDFGCGCGRVMRYWHYAGGPELHGSDYNRWLVAWCRRHLPFARFEVNRLAPPLPYRSGNFDLVYALSVFTHLTVSLQAAWRDELARVLRPGGWLAVSLHGDAYLDGRMTAEESQSYRRGEIVVRSGDHAGENYCAAFHPAAAALEMFEARFESVDMVPRGAMGNPDQDLYLFRLKVPA